MNQDAITIATDVTPTPGHRDKLEEALKRVDQMVRLDGGIFRAINADRPHVHFARWVLLKAKNDVDERPFKEQLVYVADVDQGAAIHLDALARCRRDSAGVDVLHDIYQHTENYPNPPSDGAWVEYLNSQRIDTQTFYVNKVGRTVEQVWREERLRAGIEGFLDSRPWVGMKAADVRMAVRRFVQSDAALRWALQPDSASAPSFLSTVLSVAREAGRRLIGRAARQLEWLESTPLVPPLQALQSDELEREGRADVGHVPAATIEATDERDNHGAVHSPFSVVGQVRPGPGPLIIIKGAFRLTDLGARYLYTDSNLAGITSIHFARWVFVEGNRVLFCSTYDGSAENYMSDFIDKVPWGLNFTFGRGVGFPPTFLWVFRGAEHEFKFRQVFRNRQIPAPTLVWYSAYPRLTALNLKTNHEIREGLPGEMNEAEARAWLRKL
jgi:hypothetical protein